jgi:xanthine dehydrogenase accessory factor
VSTVDFYRKITDVIAAGIPAWCVTVISATEYTPQKIGARMLVFADGSIYGTIGGGDLEHRIIGEITTGRMKTARVVRYALTDQHTADEGPDMFCGGVMELFVEPLHHGAALYIIGGGHCAVELTPLAARTGFAVTVLDPRAEWANADKHPSAIRTVCCEVAEIERHIPFADDSYIVIMTHGHEFDELALKLCLPHPHAYLGMIGSKNKSRKILERLAAEGFDREALAKVHSPLGLPIGSHTPPEIAISIMAELIAVRNSQPGLQ